MNRRCCTRGAASDSGIKFEMANSNLPANGATRVSETKSGRLSSSRRLLQEHSTCVFESQFRVNYQW